MDDVKRMRRQKLVEQIRARMRAEDFDGCLRSFKRLEQQRPLTPGELVVKSRCFQLASEEMGGLESAEEALRTAIELDEDYIPALIDLGWFHYAIQDDAKKGLSYFVRAEELGKAQVEEARDGKEKCLEELRADEVAQ